MKAFILKFLSILFLILSAHFSYAQVVNDDFLQPKEYVYMHLDNDDYLIGEDIFFKAYIINSSATKSGVLYTELLSSNGDIIEKKKHKIENGCSEGYFALKKEYRAGDYEVRAYTRYMLNWGENMIFSKKIHVCESLSSVRTSMYQSANDTSFVDNNIKISHSIVPLQFTLNKDSFQQREKISVTISRKDGKAIPETANISVSVKCKESSSPESKKDICTYLQSMLQEDTPIANKQIYKPERMLTIDGYLFKKEKWYNDIIGAYKLLPQSDVYIDVNGAFEIKTNENGFFEASFDDFYGEKIIELTPVLPKRKKKDIYAISLRKHVPIINSIKNPGRVREFDFFDEWEYAQDVTFLAIDSRSYLLNNYDKDFYRIDYKKYRPSSLYYYNAGVYSPEHISPSTMEESGAEYHYIMSQNNSTPSVSTKEQFDRRLKKIEETEDIMTAQKVLLSALWRWGYPWCDWMNMQISPNAMSLDSIKNFTEKYTEGKNVARMLSFKNFIITNDSSVVNKFCYDPAEIKKEFKKLKSKKDFAQYYEGFLSKFRVPNVYNSNINKEGYPGIKKMYKRDIPYTPNFVSFFVPDTVESNIELINNILSNKHKRYTKLQGFSHAKSFISTEYPMEAKKNISDNRRTLLWLPAAKVSQDGNIHIEFYLNSYVGSIEIEVNGMDDNSLYAK